MVVIYSTPSCSYCTMAKNWLRSQQVAYTEYDVSRDQRRAAEMMRKSGQMGVPVLEIKGQILVGFKPADIARALQS